MAELVEDFGIDKFARGSPKFDDQDLLQLNAKIIHLMPFESVQKSLIELGYDQITEAFWHSVRPNLTYIKDVAFWWSVCHGDIKTPLQDRHFIQIAKELFLPLRLALTGQEHGPELKELLPLMDRTKVLERLSA